MSPSMSPTRAMLACVWHTRAAQGSNWLTWCLLVLSALIPLVAGCISGQWARSIALGATLPLFALSALWGYLLFASLLQQTTGAMRLVPGVKRRAAIIFSVSLLVCPLLALLPATVLGHYPQFLAAMIGMVFLTPLLAILSFVMSLPALLIHKKAPHAQRTGTTPSFKTQHDLVLAALGPHARMDALATGLASFTLVTLVVAQFNQAIAGLLEVMGGTGIVAALLLWHYLFLGQLLRAVAATRLEQAQMRLAPRAPGADQLNRVLASVLLRQYGLWWLATSAAGYVALLGRGLGAAQALAFMPILLLSLPGACWLLRDYARDLPGRGDWALGLLLLHNIGVLLGIAAGRYEVLWLDGALVLVVGTIYAASRWRAMCAAPPAFPAGRSDIPTP